MCGIAGLKRMGEEPITERMIRLFLTGLEHRGNDATGIALQLPSGELHMMKVNIPAWNFCSRDDYKEFCDEWLPQNPVTVLLHTRAASQGNPNEPKNNHPMYKDAGMAIHNGIIRNDNELFKKWGLERYAETDSDLVRAIVDKWGITEESISRLNQIRGTAAVAVIHPEYPGKLLLGRSGSPLTIASNDNFFVWASEKNIIHRAMRPWVERMGIAFQKQSLDLGFSSFPDNTCWLLGDELEFHGEMRTSYGTYQEPCRRVYVGWKGRQDQWKEELERDKARASVYQPSGKVVNITYENVDKPMRLKINCPHCNKALVLKPEQQNMDRKYLSCPVKLGGCGKSLEEVKKEVVN